jgi:hypothetical protein
MEDKTYGWTVEMQLKVLKQKCPMSKFAIKIESEFQKCQNGKRKRDGRNKNNRMDFQIHF